MKNSIMKRKGVNFRKIQSYLSSKDFLRLIKKAHDSLKEIIDMLITKWNMKLSNSKGFLCFAKKTTIATTKRNHFHRCLLQKCVLLTLHPMTSTTIPLKVLLWQHINSILANISVQFEVGSSPEDRLIWMQRQSGSSPEMERNQEPENQR